MISSYAQAGHPAAAIEMFHKMELEGTKPDPVTFIAVLEAFGSIGSLQDGKLVHSRLKSLGFDEKDTSLCNALLNVYTNCGSMDEAIKIFQKMARKDLISWTCAIAGYARLGHSTESIELYQTMALEGVDPNQVTLLGVLTACKHVGLIEDGIYFYNSMVSNHSIETKEEHYGYLLARAGWIEEAEAWRRWWIMFLRELYNYLSK